MYSFSLYLIYDFKFLSYIYYLLSGQKDCPGEPIKTIYGGTVRELVANNSYGKRTSKKFYYQEMHIPVDELESKKPVKVILSNWSFPFFFTF